MDFEKYGREKRAKCPPDHLKLPTRAKVLWRFEAPFGGHVREFFRTLFLLLFTSHLSLELNVWKIHATQVLKSQYPEQSKLNNALIVAKTKWNVSL